MIIPTKDECLKILKDSNVPNNIIAHSKAVCDFAMKIAGLLGKKGINANRGIVAAGALLHDVKKLDSNNHITEGYEFIKGIGFPEVALVVKKHGLANIQDEEFAPKTWEEKIIFYADKRVEGDNVVSIDERFEHLKRRYNNENAEKELEFTKKIEKELLGQEKIG